MESLPEHVRENRRYWDARAQEWVEGGERAWARSEPSWGIWGVPERELRLLPDDMTGMDAIELGCGTAYVSAWMARRGARVTGIDASAEQLATARRLAAAHGVPLTLLHGNAEATALPSEMFDFAISEYGAAIWCEPRAWLSEARRLLRPGGRLVFLGHHPLANLCIHPDGDGLGALLHRPYFALHTLDWRAAAVDPGGIEFNLPFSGWWALFAELGFAVEGYQEPRPSESGPDAAFGVTRAWARDYPSEQVWKLLKVDR
jgi:SAM-dependent methyltransferase